MFKGLEKLRRGMLNLDQNAGQLVEGQIRRLAFRTASGVGVHGERFKPKKRPGRDPRLVVAGPKLLSGLTVSVVRNSEGFVAGARFDENGGKIAGKQNSMRQFFGFSADDKAALVNDVKILLKG